MQKFTALLIILFLGMPILIAAQDNDPDVEIDWDYYTTDLYTRGDQTFTINLGVTFPTIFINNGKSIDHNITPPVGGSGSLIYGFYFNSHLFTGFEVGGMFLPTIAGNTIYIITLGARTGTQFIAGRFEFPLHLTIGMSWHNYLNMGYYGLCLKAGGSAFFRASNDWSFGLATGWGWYPQWTSDPKKDVYGNFADLTFSARYHF